MQLVPYEPQLHPLAETLISHFLVCSRYSSRKRAIEPAFVFSNYISLRRRRYGATHNTQRYTLRPAACVRRRGWHLSSNARRVNNAIVDKRGRPPKLHAVSITLLSSVSELLHSFHPLSRPAALELNSHSLPTEDALSISKSRLHPCQA